ncbi:MAG: sodium:solute symporter family protein [Planctomycetota bacterium]
MSLTVWTYIFVGLTFSLYLTIAYLSRVKDTKGFFIAGGGVPAPANGMATAADWMSAASFISMAGLISGMGFAGGVYLMGWTGGYVLLALMLAPYLRKFGHFTVPDFIGDRYASNNARIIALLCAIFISFTYVVGQMVGMGKVFSGFLGVAPATGVFIGMAIVFVYAVFGGMKGITYTQVAQFWVLITAFLIPAIAISLKLTGNPIPSIGLGSTVLESIDPARPYLLDKLNDVNQQLGFASYTEAYGPDAGKWNKLNVFCVCLALMAGTAGLPHVIVRFYTVKSVKAARWSAFWALGFIALLYLNAPAVGAFARYYMVDNVAGLNGKTAEQLPDWYENWNSTGLIAWVDFNGDGKVAFTNNLTDEIERKMITPPTEDSISRGPVAWGPWLQGNAIQPNELMRVGSVPPAVRAELLADPDAWVAANGGLSPDELAELEQFKAADWPLISAAYAGADALEPTSAEQTSQVTAAFEREISQAERWKELGERQATKAKATLLQLGASHHPDRDIIVFATPQMAELADWMVAFVIAGGLAAALSTASGLLLVISSSVSHDLYYRVMNPRASEKQRLLVGRIAIAFAVLIAGFFGVNPPGFAGEVVALAFGLAAASFFPAIVLGIFSKRVGTVPAITGMLVGIGFTAFYIACQKADTILLNAEVAQLLLGEPGQGLRTPWFFGIDAQGIGTVGMVINFAVTLALMPFFAPPDDRVKALINSIREPEGATPGIEIEAAQSH